MEPPLNFEELANEHKDVVYRQMLRVCGNHADAEDVVMEALLRAWRNLGQLREAEAFRGWLAQIGRRVCWNLRNREALRPVLQLSTLQDHGMEARDPGPNPEDQLEMTRMKELLHQALRGLPAEYQEVYQLRDVEELPGETVASRLGISLATMKSRLHRARTSLRRSLDAALLEGKPL